MELLNQWNSIEQLTLFLQAYYGGRMPMPQYFSSPVASGHPPPPYMWAPMQVLYNDYLLPFKSKLTSQISFCWPALVLAIQHMMPPYAAMYPHGCVYAHPGVTVVSLHDIYILTSLNLHFIRQAHLCIMHLWHLWLWAWPLF